MTKAKKKWSIYQLKIFKDIQQGVGHTIVIARAGAAKTTSLIESFKYVPKGKSIIALAFNKDIQKELKKRSPSYVQASTFHSLGFQAIRQRFGNVEIDEYKASKIATEIIGEKNYDLVDNICQVVEYCKYTLSDSPEKIKGFIDRFSIDLCETPIDQFVKYVILTLSECKKMTNKIDYNDMCWFYFVYNMPLGNFDYVYVDESQDLNLSQLVMAKKVCKANGRIIVFMDDLQDIYQFRLSDSSIIEDLKKKDDTKMLSLPISYRCPKKVIGLAEKWAEDITCPSDAKEGKVENISLNKLYDIAKPGCFILSRTNAPLIKICMQLIRQGVRANIRGRDVGKQLGYLIKKSKKKQVPVFLKWLEKWKDDEVELLRSKNINTENVLDRYECLVNLCEECKALEEVSQKCKDLFNNTDENNIVILSTIHRAKGLERKDVFILKWTLRVTFDQMKFLQKPNEEANIAYVGITRAKENLYFVDKF